MEKQSSSAVLQLAPDPRYAQAAAEFLHHVATGLGMRERDARRVRDSVLATLTTAMQRSGSGRVEVICEPTVRALEVRIKDRGVPIDPRHPGEYAPPKTDISSFHPEGLGICLRHHGVDEVHFRYLGREGNETLVVQYLRSASAVPAPAEQPRPAVPADLRWDVRRMRPEDAIGVCRTLYGVYGYTYPVEAVYSPDRLIELNQGGEMLTVVAVTAEGEVFGTASLERGFGPDTMEVGVAAVLAEYRGKGAAARMSELLLEEARLERKAGCSGWGVTQHAYSQKGLVARGFHECALLVGNAPADMTMESIDQHVVQRGSVMGMYLDLEPPGRRPLFLPERHADFLLGVVRRLGLEPLEVSPGSPPDAPTILDVRANKLRAGAILGVERQGPDTFDRIRECQEHLVDTGFVELSLMLDLADPRTPVLVGRLEEKGFFLSGVLPRTRCGDALVMQYLHDVRLDYDAIQVASEYGRALREYVRSCDPAQDAGVRG